MPFKFAVRTDAATSHFKKYLAEIFDHRCGCCDQHAVILASGYFDRDMLVEQARPKCTLLDLFDAQCTSGELTLIAPAGHVPQANPRSAVAVPTDDETAYFDNRALRRQQRVPMGSRKWEHEGPAFLRAVYARIPHRVHLRSKANWHAKVALRIVHGEVVAALVGSSNVTNMAYAEQLPYFNRECDVLLWLDRDGLNRHFFGGDTVEQPENQPELIEIFGNPLDRERPPAGVAVGHTKPIDQQLTDLRDMLLNATQMIT